MSQYIKKFGMDSEERQKLNEAARRLRAKSPNSWNYYVGETWFDYGQGWAWTTILCETNNGDRYQALYPAEQEAILMANNHEQIERAVDRVLSGKFCPDRIKN